MFRKKPEEGLILHEVLLNFKTLIEHKHTDLTVQNGILKTTLHQTAVDTSQVQLCAKKTYAQIKQLFSLPLESLNKLDFNICFQLMELIHEWAGNESTKPKDIEQYRLLKLLKSCDQKISSIDKELKSEKSHQEKLTVDGSFEELFELTPSDDKSAPSNFIVFLTDEERRLRGYESQNVKKYHEEKLEGRNALAENGIICRKQRIAATACTPSRAAVYTGHYQSLHGVSQTNGLAKTSYDTAMRWLDPNVPTAGNYFEEAGYETPYFGKWHLSPEDILNDKQYPKILKPIGGEVDAKVEREYLDKDPLKKYGFHGWVGPEPHGPEAENAGFNRDPLYAQQACEWLKERDKRSDNKPFLMTVNFVNPHDIVFVPILWLYYAYKHKNLLPEADKALTDITLPPTIDDSLADKPAVQRAYRDRYSKMVCLNVLNGSTGGSTKNWNWFNQYYQKMYWTYVQLADQRINEVYDTLKKTKMYKNTYVIKTTDHGDLTGAHGMLQKWYSVYDEITNVDCIISHPRLKHKGKVYDGLTSHVDILPTMLKLAGLDAHGLTEKLKKSHSEAHDLVGTVIGDKYDFTAINTKECTVLSSSYFLTLDNVMTGDVQQTVLAQQYPILKSIPAIADSKPIHGNTHIQMVTAKLKIGNKVHQFKYALYQSPDGGTAPEEELYDLDYDPYEMRNLAKQPKLTPTETIALQSMKQLLHFEAKRKLVQPYQAELLDKPAVKAPHSKHHGAGIGFLAALSGAALLPGAALAGTLLLARKALPVAAITEPVKEIATTLATR